MGKKSAFTYSPAMIDRMTRVTPPCVRHPGTEPRVSTELAFRLAAGSPNPKRAENLVMRLIRDDELYLHNVAISLFGAAARLGGRISG
jgi:hypothetical protein